MPPEVNPLAGGGSPISTTDAQTQTAFQQELGKAIVTVAETAVLPFLTEMQQALQEGNADQA